MIKPSEISIKAASTLVDASIADLANIKARISQRSSREKDLEELIFLLKEDNKFKDVIDIVIYIWCFFLIIYVL